MSDPYISQIILVGFNFAPVGYAFCDGQTMSIAQNDTLFNLIGTTYGGDGVTTFNLPDLRGRAPISMGQGPGLQNYSVGEAAGNETIVLNANQMPQHNHTIDTAALTATAKCKNASGNQATPVGNVPAVEAAGATATYSSAAPDANMRAGSIVLSGAVGALPAGGNLAHDNMQPYLAMNYCIALQGIFPSQ